MPGQQKNIICQPKDKNIWQTIQIDELFNQRSKIYRLPKITSTYPSFHCMKQARETIEFPPGHAGW